MATAKLKQTCPCGWRKKCFCGAQCNGKFTASVNLNMNLSSTHKPTGTTYTERGSLSGSFTGEYIASQNSETGEISVSGSVEGSKCVTEISGRKVVDGWEDDIVVVCGSFNSYQCPGGGYFQYTPTGSCGGGSCAQTSNCVITYRTGKTYQNFGAGFSYIVNKKGGVSNFVWGVSYSGPENTNTGFDFYPKVGSVNLSINGGPSGETKALFGSVLFPSFQTLTAGGSISIQLDKG